MVIIVDNTSSTVLAHFDIRFQRFIKEVILAALVLYHYTSKYTAQQIAPESISQFCFLLLVCTDGVWDL